MKLAKLIFILLMLHWFNPAFGAVSLDPGAVLGIDNTDDQVLQYDPATGAVVGTVPLETDNYVGLTTIGSVLYAASVVGDVYQVDPATGARTFLFNVPTSENIGRYGDNLIYSGHSSGEFGEITTSGTSVRTGSLAAGATGLEGDANSNRIFTGQYSGNDTGDIRIYDGTTLAFLGTVDIGLPGSAISGMSYNPDADQFWIVTGFGDNQIRKYDSNGTLLDTFDAASTWVNALTVVPGSASMDAVPVPSVSRAGLFILTLLVLLVASGSGIYRQKRAS